MFAVGWALNAWTELEFLWVVLCLIFLPGLIGLIITLSIVILVGASFKFRRDLCPHCGEKALPVGVRMTDIGNEGWRPFPVYFTQPQCEACDWQVRRYDGGLIMEIAPGDEEYISR